MSRLVLLILINLLIFTGCFNKSEDSNSLKSKPKIGVANLGPHPSLEATISGMVAELAKSGLKSDIDYELINQHVSFEPSMIRPMLAQIKAKRPDVLVTLTTPVSQAAQAMNFQVPHIFASITDPGSVGLNLSGASDKQDLDAVLSLAKKLLPNAKKVGLLYSTSEANDAALKKILTRKSKEHNLELLSVGIDQPRDIPLRIQKLFQGENKVDFIYVGVSGMIQPSLPAIVAASDKMKIPVFNADESGVLSHMALASNGVNYFKVGANTGKLVFEILKNKSKDNKTKIINPKPEDHEAFISKKRAKFFGIRNYKNIKSLKVVK